MKNIKKEKKKLKNGCQRNGQIPWQSSETDQYQLDQKHIQCILNGICNNHVDLDPFLKIANPF